MTLARLISIPLREAAVKNMWVAVKTAHGMLPDTLEEIINSGADFLRRCFNLGDVLFPL
jgi:hypothetical protein